MSDRFDDLISGALSDFHAAEPTADMPIPGAAAVHATVTHRRKVRIMALSVVGVLLIAGPIAAFAANPRGNNPPPVPGESVSPTVIESPSVSPVPTAPDGRISMAELMAVKVSVPDVFNREDATENCKGGEIRLGARDSRSARPWLTKVVHANLDADSSLETAALVQCQWGEALRGEVVAFDRNDSGKIVTLGRMTDGFLHDVTARAEGGVTVDVSDTMACCGNPKSIELHHNRGYAWRSTGFTQVDGPTSFLPHKEKIDLKLALKDVGYGAEDVLNNGDRVRELTFRLEVTNLGPAASGQWIVIDAVEGSWARWIEGAGIAQPSIPTGGTARITVKVMASLSYFENAQTAGIGVYELGSPTVGGDVNTENNYAPFTYRP